MESLISMKNLPNEIVLQILGYLSFWELIQCARVSKRLNTICKDSLLGHRSSILSTDDLIVKDQNSIIDILIARPEVTEVIISWQCPIGQSPLLPPPCLRWEMVQNQLLPKFVVYYH